MEYICRINKKGNATAGKASVTKVRNKVGIMKIISFPGENHHVPRHGSILYEHQNDPKVPHMHPTYRFNFTPRALAVRSNDPLARSITGTLASAWNEMK